MAENISESRNELDIIVHEISTTLKIHSCSIFSKDHNSEKFVLSAGDKVKTQWVRIEFIVNVNLQGEDRLYGFESDELGTKLTPSIPGCIDTLIGSSLCVPIRKNRQIVGVILLHNLCKSELSDESVAWLLTISVRIGRRINLGVSRLFLDSSPPSIEAI